MSSIPLLALNSGHRIPQLGLGVFKIEPEQTADIVVSALEVGYRHIDTAVGYNNEAGVGEGIRRSGLRREDVFVTTKLHDDDHVAGRTFDAFDESLDRLGFDYVDLYLVHWPLPSRGLYLDTWKQFEQILASGRARSIGVSNFLEPHLQAVLDANGVVPALNQLEIHPAYQQRGATALNARAGVVTAAWSPLAQGGLDSSDSIVAIAGRHGKSVAQVILRWHVQHGRVAIPKTVNRSRMIENADIFDFELAADEMAVIDATDRGGRLGSDPHTRA